jgi:hypothetical protein
MISRTGATVWFTVHRERLQAVHMYSNNERTVMIWTSTLKRYYIYHYLISPTGSRMNGVPDNLGRWE